MAAQIRQAEAGDSDLVAALIARLLNELAEDETAADPERLGPVTARLLEEGAINALLALEADRPVGVVTINECAAIYAGGHFGEITELYVDPGLRSSGLGRQLIEAASAFARTRGWPRLEVGAPDLPRWQRTVDFYQSCGFTIVGPRLRLILSTP